MMQRVARCRVRVTRALRASASRCRGRRFRRAAVRRAVPSTVGRRPLPRWAFRAALFERGLPGLVVVPPRGAVDARHALFAARKRRRHDALDHAVRAIVRRQVLADRAAHSCVKIMAGRRPAARSVLEPVDSAVLSNGTLFASRFVGQPSHARVLSRGAVAAGHGPANGMRPAPVVFSLLFRVESSCAGSARSEGL